MRAERPPRAYSQNADLEQNKAVAEHARLTAKTAMRIFSADNHSPLQRGSNERIRGLLLLYLPRITPWPSENKTTSTLSPPASTASPEIPLTTQRRTRPSATCWSSFPAVTRHRTTVVFATDVQFAEVNILFELGCP